MAALLGGGSAAGEQLRASCRGKTHRCSVNVLKNSERKGRRNGWKPEDGDRTQSGSWTGPSGPLHTVSLKTEPTAADRHVEHTLGDSSRLRDEIPDTSDGIRL